MLLDGVLRETQDYLVTHAALALSKVARYEFPNDWYAGLLFYLKFYHAYFP
jgi:hypothetical protein